MMAVLLALGMLAALALGVVGYAGWRMGQPPAGSPAEFLGKRQRPSERPVLVCLGGSITHAGLGAGSNETVDAPWGPWKSWDSIGHSRGLVMTTDTIHPNNRAAAVMLDLVEPWARRALSLRSAT